MKKKNKAYKITSNELFDFKKPKYNGFAIGYGAHGKSKYDRNQQKREFRRDLDG